MNDSRDAGDEVLDVAGGMQMEIDAARRFRQGGKSDGRRVRAVLAVFGKENSGIRP